MVHLLEVNQVIKFLYYHQVLIVLKVLFHEYFLLLQFLGLEFEDHYHQLKVLLLLLNLVDLNYHY